MRFKKIKQKYKDWFGCGPISIICGTLLVVISLEIEEKLEISKINISDNLVYVLIGLLVLALVGLSLIFNLVIIPAVRGKKKLVTYGAYSYVRHPMYSVMIFLIYPLVALILKSWVVLVSTLFLYLGVAKLLIKIEEKEMIKNFGVAYEKYMNEVGGFLPKLKIFRK